MKWTGGKLPNINRWYLAVLQACKDIFTPSHQIVFKKLLSASPVHASLTRLDLWKSHLFKANLSHESLMTWTI
jgi:hypothetical protein